MATARSLRLPCGFSENDLIAAVLGDASSRVNDLVYAHVAECHSCAALLDQYRFLRTSLTALSLVGNEEAGLHEARRVLEARLIGKNRPRLFLDVWHSPVGDIRIGKTDKGVALVEFVNPEKHGEASLWQSSFVVET